MRTMIPGMRFIFTNNAASTIADASISPVATTLNVAPGDGGLFPSPVNDPYAETPSEVFALTAISSAGLIEVMYCTARTGDTMTVMRGQEGTTPLTLAAGDVVSHRVTAGTLDMFPQVLYPAMDGYIPTLDMNGNIAGQVDPSLYLNRNIASQAEAEAGTDNTKDMTPLRVAQAIAALASPDGGNANLLDGYDSTYFYSPSNPPPATVDSYNAVGSYALAINTSSTTVTPGGTIAGSNLNPITIGVIGYDQVNGGPVVAKYYNSALSGTWKCMGYSERTGSFSTGYYYGAAVWERIA